MTSLFPCKVFLLGLLFLAGFQWLASPGVLAQEQGNRYVVNGYAFRGKDKKPAANVKVYVYLITENSGRQCQEVLANPPETDSNGRFRLEFDSHKSYTVRCFLNGYGTPAYTFPPVTVSEGQQISVDIPVDQQPVPYLSGMVYDANDKSPLAGAAVSFIDKAEGGPCVTMTTGESGGFFFFADTAHRYSFHVQKTGYRPSRSDIDFYRVGRIPYNQPLLKTQYISTSIMEPFPFRVNSAGFMPHAKSLLEGLLQRLEADPGLSVEIACHSDARGDDNYNQWLSEERAKAVAAFFYRHGIHENRVVPLGYGETELLNECANGVKCSNDRHGENRRLEVRVLAQ